MRRWVPSLFAAGVAACSSGNLSQTTGIFETIGGSEGEASSGDADTSTGADPSTTGGSDPSTTDASADATSEVATTGESTSTSAGSEESTGGGAETTSASSSTTETAMLACVDDDLGSALGNGVASGNSSGDGDDVGISCAGGDGEDAVYSWTAPSAGAYTFDLSGSSYDTAMAIVATDCDGAELGCNDDSVGLTSAVTVDLGAGEQVLVVIDGYMGAVGSFVLDVNHALDLSCVDEDLLGATGAGVTAGSTVGDDDTFSPSCVTDGADVVLAWTAPSTATWHISLSGSSYDTALAIWSPDCGGNEIACNDDGAVDLTSELDIDVTVGETVLLVVDGYMGATGSFTLTID